MEHPLSATTNRLGRDEADLMFQDVIDGNIIQMADRVMETLQAYLADCRR